MPGSRRRARRSCNYSEYAATSAARNYALLPSTATEHARRKSSQTEAVVSSSARRFSDGRNARRSEITFSFIDAPRPMLGSDERRGRRREKANRTRIYWRLFAYCVYLFCSRRPLQSSIFFLIYSLLRHSAVTSSSARLYAESVRPAIASEQCMALKLQIRNNFSRTALSISQPKIGETCAERSGENESHSGGMAGISSLLLFLFRQ